MKTKYKKVRTSERLPEKEGKYVCSMQTTLKMDACMPFDPNHEDAVIFWKNEVDWWLCEVPDYEDEMREILLQLVGCHTCGHKIPDWLNDKAEELLTKLKKQ